MFYHILFQSIFPICSCCNLTCSNFWAVIFPLQFTVAMDELLDFHLAFIMSISYFIFISHKYFSTSQLFSQFKSLKCCTIFYCHHKMPVPLAAAIIERIAHDSYRVNIVSRLPDLRCYSTKFIIINKSVHLPKLRTILLYNQLAIL